MNTAILVLDLINDIVSPSGKTPSCAAHAAERQIMAKANIATRFARDKGWLVVHVKVGFSAHYAEHPLNSPVFGKAKGAQALKLGEWGTDFHQELVVDAQDCILIKHRVSPFYGTPLDLLLRNNQVSRLLISGVSSTWAVQAAAREGHDRDYQIMIIEDACAAATEEEHQLSMRQLSRIARILTSADLPSLTTT